MRVRGRSDVDPDARLWAGDRLCAEATGLFITIRPGYFEQLMKARDQREGT